MLARWQALRAELGSADALRWIAARALAALSRGQLQFKRYYFVAQPVALGEAPTASALARFWWAQADDAIVQHFPRPPAVIAQRFAQGDQCLVAQIKGRFAGFIWIARGHYDEDEVRCRFVLADASQTAWDYDVYVEPEFRFSRTLARLWGHTHARLAGEGIGWTLSRISAFNAASLASHRRLGARVLSSASFLVLGHWELALLPGLRVHFSASPQQAPQLSLRPPPP